LTFSSVPVGSRPSATIAAKAAVSGAEIEKSKRRPSWKSSFGGSDCWETAIAGMPRTMPSSAAATVPE